MGSTFLRTVHTIQSFEDNMSCLQGSIRDVTRSHPESVNDIEFSID